MGPNDIISINIEQPSRKNDYSGVYAIYCAANNRIYIGSSKSINRRFTQHKTTLRNGNGRITLLQRAWTKYREESFIFKAIEKCENYVEREYFYINNLSREHSLNITKNIKNKESYQQNNSNKKSFLRTKEYREKFSAMFKGTLKCAKFGPENGKSFLSEDTVLNLYLDALENKKLTKSGQLQKGYRKFLAKNYGLTERSVKHILIKNCWHWLTDQFDKIEY